VGYEVIFVHIDNISVNQVRVLQRVSEGRHHMHDDKVISRISRALLNIKETLSLYDRCYLVAPEELLTH